MRALLLSLATGAAAGPAGMPISKFDLDPKAMFTHADKELHCPYRELIHPCTTELRSYLKGVEERDESHKQAAFDCATTVYDTVNDFQVTKNMTHLLLDLDTSKHFFDKNLKAENEFFRLGLKFGKKLIWHKDCMQEFDDKDELECRCPLLYGKIIILKLKNLGWWHEAEDLYKTLKAFEWKGEKKQIPAGEAFPWKTMQQTPHIWMHNLEAIPVWPVERKSELPIWPVLEDNYPDILRETMAAFQNKTDLVEESYRFLFQGGHWDQILLFHDRKYTEACKAFPITCGLLKKTLPDRPQHHYPIVPNEQALILRLKVGTDVETHCGPSNNILNVHLGLTGTEGAKLIIANSTYGWEDGKVIAWDGSFHHKVHCKDCVKDRFVMMVRYMHPGVTTDHYRGSTKTHMEPIPEDWIAEWKKEEEVGAAKASVLGRSRGEEL